MRRWLEGAGLVVAAVPAAVAYAALLGLGLHRHASPFLLAAVATGAVFGPALLAGATAPRERRPLVFAGVLAAWSLALFVALPVYFPGEREQAIATGLSLIGLGDARWERVARDVADQLPQERPVARPEVPEAETLVQEAPPPARELAKHEISLPYEGEGRRLSVPVVFEHQGRVIETWMMLDTGATYTTLPEHVLRALGIEVGPEHPTIRLHTANGERDAQVVLLDEVWLGNLSLQGVAVATCEECANDENAGLLGLNVTGGFNLFIDADREEVVFTQRPGHDQRLDAVPFVELDASFRRFPGGRVEVTVNLHNDAPRALDTAHAAVSCGEQTWRVELVHVDAGQTATTRRRLPPHDPCPAYRIALDGATW